LGTGGRGRVRGVAGPERSWFRYHRLFADLLALELRRTAPQELPGLHAIAAEWLAEHGSPVQAIRHAQAAEDWGMAARLLADNWRSMYLDGQMRLATARELLSGFPADVVARDAELTVLAAADRRTAGSLREAERYLALAERMSPLVPEGRQGRFQVAMALVRLGLGRARNDLDGVAEQARRLLALADSPGAFEAGVGEEGLRATALIDLGAAEMWSGQLEVAEGHLEQGLEEARQIGRPILELQALSHLAILSLVRSPAVAEGRATEAIELARAHGWEETGSAVATAYLALGSLCLRRAQLAEAEGWLERAEFVVQRFTQPTTAMMIYTTRALLEFARCRYEAAMTAQRAAERIGRVLATRHILATRAQALKLEMLVQTGETDMAVRALDDMDEHVCATGEARIVQASLRLAQNDPQGAEAALAEIFAGVSPIENPPWKIQALLLQARVEDALGDLGASSRSLERALELAEPEGLVLPFLLHPAPELLERQSRLRTTHAALISEILNLLSGHALTARREHAEPLREALSDAELRVLRYLPTNLPAQQIATELFVSLNTIRTHLRNVYAKLGVHSRADAVNRARALGLLSHPLKR
jgi:LuxR family transcriptional regulator, maltose regulon positive regulatory protein